MYVKMIDRELRVNSDTWFLPFLLNVTAQNYVYDITRSPTPTPPPTLHQPQPPLPYKCIYIVSSYRFCKSFLLQCLT